MAPRRPTRSIRDEPRPDRDEISVCGDQALVVAGYTAGGFPFGSTVEEFREAAADFEPMAGWAQAKRAFEVAIHEWSGGRSSGHVGWVKHIGRGLSRDVYTAEIDVPGEGAGWYAALVPAPDADPDVDERAVREVALLLALRKVELPIRIPRRAVATRVGGRVVLVREMLTGVPLDPRAGRQAHVRPWEVIGTSAAAIHGVPASLIEGLSGIEAHATRAAHLQHRLRSFDGLTGPEIEAARSWAKAHAPKSERATLVHGDMLGQNVLLQPGARPGIIDWEYAFLGDPAYDLAIVTRAVRRPFQIDRGLLRLVDAYRSAGGRDIRASEVRAHELCLAAQWYRTALEASSRHERSGERPGDALARLIRVLRLAEADGETG